MSSPFPFRIGCVLDYVCHSGSSFGIFKIFFDRADYTEEKKRKREVLVIKISDDDKLPIGD